MCAAGMSEEWLREIVREEILAARLAEEDHERPGLARSHHHYDLALLGHEHDFTHDHLGKYGRRPPRPLRAVGLTEAPGQLAVSLVELALGRLQRPKYAMQNRQKLPWVPAETPVAPTVEASLFVGLVQPEAQV